MITIVLRPIFFAAAAAAAVLWLFGSLFGDSHENHKWIVPTEARAAVGDGLKTAVAEVRTLRDPGNLWDRRAPRNNAEPVSGWSAPAVDRSMAMALQPVDVEQELAHNRPKSLNQPGGRESNHRPRAERVRDEEWLRVHTPPRPPPLEQMVPAEVNELVSREPGPDATVIVADAATNYEMDGRLVLFEGGVSLQGPDFNLSSQRLDVHMGDEKNQPQKMIAYGDVKVHTTGEARSGSNGGAIVASSQRATFDPVSETLLLEGWPQLNDGQGRNLTASNADTVITIHTRTGKIVTSGRTRSRLSMDR